MKSAITYGSLASLLLYMTKGWQATVMFVLMFAIGIVSLHVMRKMSRSKLRRRIQLTGQATVIPPSRTGSLAILAVSLGSMLFIEHMFRVELNMFVVLSLFITTVMGFWMDEEPLTRSLRTVLQAVAGALLWVGDVRIIRMELPIDLGAAYFLPELITQVVVYLFFQRFFLLTYAKNRLVNSLGFFTLAVTGYLLLVVNQLPLGLLFIGIASGQLAMLVYNANRPRNLLGKPGMLQLGTLTFIGMSVILKDDSAYRVFGVKALPMVIALSGILSLLFDYMFIQSLRWMAKIQKQEYRPESLYDILKGWGYKHEMVGVIRIIIHVMILVLAFVFGTVITPVLAISVVLSIMAASYGVLYANSLLPWFNKEPSAEEKKQMESARYSKIYRQRLRA